MFIPLLSSPYFVVKLGAFLGLREYFEYDSIIQPARPSSPLCLASLSPRLLLAVSHPPVVVIQP